MYRPFGCNQLREGIFAPSFTKVGTKKTNEREQNSMGTQLVDTHSHLHDKEFASDYHEVLERARQANVSRILLVGEDSENSKLAVKAAENSSHAWASVGVHPHRADSFDTSTLATLRSLATQSNRVVAIGEIGLDFHYDFSPREKQVAVFRSQIELALELELPIIVHCREAYDLALSILQSVKPRQAKWPWGVMHCYFGTLAQAYAFTEAGLFLGIGGSVTFKNAHGVREVVEQLPVESFVLETDAPYMAPVPYRGKRNEPSFLPLVAEKIAEVKGIPVDTVASVTTANAYRLFRWEKS